MGPSQFCVSRSGHGVNAMVQIAGCNCCTDLRRKVGRFVSRLVTFTVCEMLAYVTVRW